MLDDVDKEARHDWLAERHDIEWCEKYDEYEADYELDWTTFKYEPWVDRIW